MGAPSPELVDLWLARAFNAHDVEAAAAMYHPEASVVRLEQVHGSTLVARGADGIRETMAGYIGLKPHMDVVAHHTTVSGDFALCRSQWRITGTDQDGKPLEVHHHAMEVMRRLPNGEWVFFIDHPWGRTRRGQSNVRRAQSRRTAATRSRHAQLGSRGQAHISRPREIAWDSFIHGEAEGAVAAGADVVVPPQVQGMDARRECSSGGCWAATGPSSTCGGLDA
jgi:ketosteroid isomerase-like protein